MPKYPSDNYKEFVAITQECGSGLGTRWHSDGALKALGELLRKDSRIDDIVRAITALSRVRDNAQTNKLRKYRKAIAYLERTFPIPRAQRKAPIEGRSTEAIRYVMSATLPTATPNTPINNSGAFMTKSAAQIGLNMTVPEYMAAHADNVRVLLIHLGTPKEYMSIEFDGVSSLEHMNAVLRTASEYRIHVCVLCDPHERGMGVGTPTAGDAVCDGLRHAVGAIPETHIRVADAGSNHSAFHDPAHRDWVTAPGVNSIVVMGYQADVCVRGNVFGISETLQGSQPPRLVPALINVKDVITAKPLLWADGGSIGAFVQWGMHMCGPNRD